MTGVRLPAGAEIFLFFAESRQSLGTTQPPIHWVQRREADYSPLTSGEVKNAWSSTSTLPICVHSVVLN